MAYSNALVFLYVTVQNGNRESIAKLVIDLNEAVIEDEVGEAPALLR